jgi:LCP family protein required for cell wall assembly
VRGVRTAARPRHATGPVRRSWFQRSVLVVNAGACLACFALVAALLWSYHRVREIPRIDLSTELAEPDLAASGSDQPQNVLIVGTDSADGLPDDDPVRAGRDHGVRTDTIMLLRIDPATEQASLLSLPRDLYVPIAGTRGSSRINAAIQGGPGQLVATITDALDLPVHHYVEVDFAGFRDLVDAIGGVPVYFPEPVRDRHSGLEVPTAGCITLDPEQALAYARARAYEVFRDGHWDVDGTGDLGRISRQQDFIRRALHAAFQRGGRNPSVLLRLIDEGVQAISLDGTLTARQLGDIGQRFRTFDPEELVTYELPVTDAVIDGAAVLRLDDAGAQPILDVFRGADPDRVAPDNTVVEVLNGTTTSGLAEEAAEGLRALHFVVPPDNTGDHTSSDLAVTTVRYHEGHEAQAALVISALGGDPVVEEGGAVVGADVTIVIGADWPGLAPSLRPPTPGLLDVPAPDPLATTTTAVAGATTTTQVFGEVPEQPAGAGC